MGSDFGGYIRGMLRQVSSSQFVSALEFNGIRVDRSGKFLCPFHADHSPSATIKKGTSRGKCWSCNASIDAINVTAKVQGMAQKEAAVLLHTQGICHFEEIEEELAENEKCRLRQWALVKNMDGCPHACNKYYERYLAKYSR